MKKLLALLMVFTLTLGLCSCGGGSKFTVESVVGALVGTPSFIEGKMGNDVKRVDINNAFKGCTLVNLDMKADAETVFKGTEDGLIAWTCDFILTYEDESGNQHELTLKVGDSFETVTENNVLYLVLPQ